MAMTHHADALRIRDPQLERKGGNRESRAGVDFEEQAADGRGIGGRRCQEPPERLLIRVQSCGDWLESRVTLLNHGEDLRRKGSIRRTLHAEDVAVRRDPKNCSGTPAAAVAARSAIRS